MRVGAGRGCGGRGRRFRSGKVSGRDEEVTFFWYMGLALTIYGFWVAEAFVGASFGNLVPNADALGMDFLLPIYFLGLVLSFRMRPRWWPIVITSAVTSIVAYETIGSPWHVSVGALAGMLLAAFLPIQAKRSEDA